MQQRGGAEQGDKRCMIRNKEQPELYVHYNPKKSAYIAWNGALGACVFDEYNAKGAVETMFGSGWEIVPVGEVQVVKGKSTEQELFDKLHDGK